MMLSALQSSMPPAAHGSPPKPHMQVLHSRSCSGVGLYFVRFLAACYLTFNMDHGSVDQAMHSLPPLPPSFQRTGSMRPSAGSLPLPLSVPHP